MTYVMKGRQRRPRSYLITRKFTNLQRIPITSIIHHLFLRRHLKFPFRSTYFFICTCDWCISINYCHPTIIGSQRILVIKNNIIKTRQTISQKKNSCQNGIISRINILCINTFVPHKLIAQSSSGSCSGTPFLYTKQSVNSTPHITLTLLIPRMIILVDSIWKSNLVTDPVFLLTQIHLPMVW